MSTNATEFRFQPGQPRGKAHGRTDLGFMLIKGRGMVSGRVAYAVVITQGTWSPDIRCIYHVETFHSGDNGKGGYQNGTQLRAAAQRWARSLISGKTRLGCLRSQHLPHGFVAPANMPCTEKAVPLNA